jgi:hypothetical protein
VREPFFLISSLGYRLRTLLCDFLSFTTFLLFHLILGIVGLPLLAIDRRFRTHGVDRLIRFFEFFAR